ncbi:MAG: Abi family protein [Faecalicatena sp.]|uniref:Abi family protein n=1 Tax=Faecalicatena sp. TaxID=2005360 RepID=UPI00258F1BFD|nr:Abi family protein [Faecalicatena sp.]MCI6465672.1 Abi family protein [Faecalicatena sp.]MDY5618053.1 Abi family protein [Lachnospiraceae bacterium]
MEFKKLQKAMTIEEQIENLKALNLKIEDEAFAARFLNDVSYFRFVKAYSLGLKPKNGNYYDGVTFGQLVELYLFNANFRQLLFTQIEKVEINLRCRVSNHFSSVYGVLGYKNSQNFSNTNYHAIFLNDIQSEVNRNKRASFIKNFQNNYENGDIPFYALVEVFSFGTLSKFFKNMQSKDKKAIASTYGIGYTYFESWIESIAYVRNLCAHYGRLYNAKLTKTPKLYPQDRNLGISNIRIFGTLVCLKRILPSDRHWIEFVDTIQLLFEKYPYVEKDSMGFPNNWIDILK